jgi:serine/threonine-protein kinase
MSPDGNWVGFFDFASSTLKKVSVNGGPAVTLGPVVGAAGAIAGGSSRGASWGPDDTIVFATNDLTGLLRVSAGGGKAEVLTTPNAQKGEADHWWPEILPGGEAVLFTILPTTGGIENAQIAVLNLRTGEQKVLVPGGSYPRYVPTGHIVYRVAGTLRAVAFDIRRLEVRSDPVPVLQRVVTKGSGAASFSVAQDGSLVYLAGDAQGDAGHTLVWVDRQGREEPLKTPPRAYSYPRISPDGPKVALDIRDQESDIWIWDVARATLMRLTFDPGMDRFPVWTPDGRRIAFSSMRAGASNLFWQAADGTGPVERLTESANEQNPTSFSPAGTPLVFYEVASTTARDIAVLSLEGERRATPLVQTPFEERDAVVSPDGHWVAYGSNESGQFEVYVRPFPEVDRGRWQVSTGGGMWPLWPRSGRELFYLVLPGRMMAVPIQSGPTFAAGNPQVVFEGRYFTGGGRSYDVSPDGRRFLMIKDASATSDTSTPPQLIIVQNWQSGLAAREIR